MTARKWVFTLNNYTEEEVEHIKSLSTDLSAKNIRYLCFGKEIAPSTGTPHLQGYIEFINPVRPPRVSAVLGRRCRNKKANGTAEQNRVYCSKEEGEFFEAGRYSRGQGSRSDLDKIREMIQDGATEKEIAEQHFAQWVRYRASFQAYRTLILNAPSLGRFPLDSFPNEWPRIMDWSKTIVLWGDSGIGKTQFALALIGKALLVSHMDDLKKFDTSIHEGIIFDDMDINHFPRSAQIHITDQDQDRSIHCRYGNAIIPMNTKKIFTTNEENGACMLVTDPAIKRRILVIHLGIFQ